MRRNRVTPGKSRRTVGPKIVFAPEGLVCLASGFDRLAAALAVTLGPTQGPILNARDGGSVELLSDAGTIARRVLEISGRSQNTGAMIVRHLAWRMHEEFGDGAATAAVLARAMVQEGVKRVAAGIDPQLIRRGLERSLPVALAELTAQAEPVSGPQALTAAATGITGDPKLAAVLAEIVDLLGSDAALTIEEFPVPYLDREYVEGAYWRAYPAARAMVPEGRGEVVLNDPLILLVDQALDEIDDIRPGLDLAANAADRRPLLIIAPKLGESVLTVINTNHARGTVTAVASQLSSHGRAHTDDLGDLATLTGGTVMAEVLGRPPRRLRLQYLGTAHRAIVSRESLTIVGGGGNRRAIDERLAALRRQQANLTVNESERQGLQARVARLSGGIAILKIGAHMETDLAHRRARAEQGFRVLTGMLSDGAVPGGGVAYLHAMPAVRACRDTGAHPDEGHGVDVLLAALEAPFTQIVRNHGVIHPPLALDEACRGGRGHGVDVMTGENVDMRARGILDSLKVARGALQVATSAAISTLTTAVVILPATSKQEQQVRP